MAQYTKLYVFVLRVTGVTENHLLTRIFYLTNAHLGGVEDFDMFELFSLCLTYFFLISVFQCQGLKFYLNFMCLFVCFNKHYIYQRLCGAV